MNRIKCNCPCHIDPENIKHFQSCCDNGYIDLEIPNVDTFNKQYYANTPEGVYLRLVDTLSKFVNGEYRYKHDPLFNTCIERLIREEDPYKIIDNLIEVVNSVVKELGNIREDD